MPKIDMTPEIGQKIKEWRLQFNVKSKDLAEYISKSPAYISKLEKGNIKQIDKSLLENIVVFISGDNNGYEKFIEKATEDISSEELDGNSWYLNFETIDCKIPVPQLLIDFIKSKMLMLNIDSNKLCDYINQNEDLSDEFFKANNINKSDVPLNTWIMYKMTVTEEKQIKLNLILLDLKPQKLDKILSRKSDKCNYIYLFAVVYHLLKLEETAVGNEIDKEELKEQTAEILRSYKFYKLSDRNKFREQSKTQKEYEKLLSDSDLKNGSLINELLKSISFLSDYDVKYANDKLTKIIENTKFDMSFAFSFMAIPLEPLKNINVDLKREFLGKVSDLVQSYTEKTDAEKEIAKY